MPIPIFRCTFVQESAAVAKSPVQRVILTSGHRLPHSDGIARAQRLAGASVRRLNRSPRKKCLRSILQWRRLSFALRTGCRDESSIPFGPLTTDHWPLVSQIHSRTSGVTCPRGMDSDVSGTGVYSAQPEPHFA